MLTCPVVGRRSQLWAVKRECPLDDPLVRPQAIVPNVWRILIHDEDFVTPKVVALQNHAGTLNKSDFSVEVEHKVQNSDDRSLRTEKRQQRLGPWPWTLSAQQSFFVGTIRILHIHVLYPAMPLQCHHTRSAPCLESQGLKHLSREATQVKPLNNAVLQMEANGING